MAPPTVASINKRMAEFRRLELHGFLAKYAKNVPPHHFYVRSDGVNYPMKALWAASHRPPILPRKFKPMIAMSGFDSFGYRIVRVTAGTAKKNAVLLASQATEGERFCDEVVRIRRNPKIVAQAKAYYGAVCQACDLDFETFYGTLGKDYIECHHINPLSGRDGEGEVTAIQDLAMLCANCHRMVHRKTPCLTVKELKRAIRSSR
ncbi:HNH endonuclease [Mesorhizobium sp.]|uniref:HNH endonuclease n=1 Tax=Mesorhizobium sp. TaxID=1871066 RepID=UPI0025C65C3F|nr:HNH endonuclease [Mesorhizobium sp.]